MNTKLLGILCCAFITSACVPPMVMEKANSYKDQGYAAQKNNNWRAASDLFARSLTQANLAAAEVDFRGEVTYQYARSLAATCQFDLAAEKYAEAISLYKEAGLSHYLIAYELATVYEMHKKYAAAMPFYTELISATQNKKIRELPPLRLALMYEKYANIMTSFNRRSEADTYNERAAEIRKHNPDATMPEEVTPFGQHCN